MHRPPTRLAICVHEAGHAIVQLAHGSHPWINSIAVDGLPGAEISGNNEVDAVAAGLTSFNVIVSAPPDAGKTGSNPIHFEIEATDNDDIKVREKASFLQP